MNTVVFYRIWYIFIREIRKIIKKTTKNLNDDDDVKFIELVIGFTFGKKFFFSLPVEKKKHNETLVHTCYIRIIPTLQTYFSL